MGRYLEMSLTEDSGVRKQDGYRVIVGVSRNLIGRYIAWNWIRDNWDRLINGVAKDFNTPFELAELETFIVDHEDELGSAGRDAKQMVESTKANINWMNQHYQTIVDWLKQNE